MQCITPPLEGYPKRSVAVQRTNLFLLLCKVVAEPGIEGVLKESGVHYLLLGALLDPQALGIPHLEDQSCRAVALLTKVRKPFTRYSP